MTRPSRLLLVDDSRTFLQHLAAALEVDGYAIDVARSGEEALHALERALPDAVLLDMVMPGLSGPETCRLLRARPEWRDLPVLMLTSQDERAAIPAALGSGADDFAVKDADTTVLRARLKAQLQRRQAEQDSRRMREQLIDSERRAAEANAARRLAETRAALLADLARQNQELRDSEHRFRVVVEAGRALGESLDLEATLQALRRLLLAGFADSAVVVTRFEEGPPRALCSDTDPRRDEELRARLERDPLRLDALARVLRTGQAQPRQPVALGALPPASALAVPMWAGGRLIGAIAVLRYPPKPAYDPKDLDVALELGGRAGLALENARLYEASRQAVAVRDEFLTIASHELRTPLTALQLRVEHLGRQLRERDLQRIDLAGAAQGIERATARLARLIDSLLDLSRIQGGPVELEREPVDLAEVAYEVADRLREDAARVGSTLELSAPRPVVGQWERDRVDQMLANLISNAIKYGRGRPVDIEVSGDEHLARCVVRDRGIGIAPADQARIFDRFERAVSTRHYGGFGLGLWIVRRMVNELGGEILVESQAGLGSTFTVLLLRQPPAQPHAGVPAPPEH